MAFRYLLSWWYIENTWLLSLNLPWINCILQTARLKISDITNMIQILSSVEAPWQDPNMQEGGGGLAWEAGGRGWESLMSLMITLLVDHFCRFQPCNGIMWFCSSDCKPLTPLSKSQWNVVKCQNSETTDIFCSVYEIWELSVQFDHANVDQFLDLRFNLEIFVFSPVIFASSISSEIPLLKVTFCSNLQKYLLRWNKKSGTRELILNIQLFSKKKGIKKWLQPVEWVKFKNKTSIWAEDHTKYCDLSMFHRSDLFHRPDLTPACFDGKWQLEAILLTLYIIISLLWLVKQILQRSKNWISS